MSPKMPHAYDTRHKADIRPSNPVNRGPKAKERETESTEGRILRIVFRKLLPKLPEDPAGYFLRVKELTNIALLTM